ncbi:NADH dehydrogenase subunit 4L (mitochondrion) [Stylophora pistillata]|uniref:NADH-ubiquinone oxidoreductase chain 4L n=7 Tax=Pocilloporidae TaxID=46729 RepID=A7XPE0_POCDA|nr:NADH dehydrogenase subunit 4L [Pocillopora damicornis]YP_001456727.1 NADH dehydrogenase subunit 4L [Pocillopora grandis]YP_001649188.1 NADH dehydrogenase subunit 4L [Seriatopora hystrix]YP_001649201.1 NADH dehydrogenase subunit 4L [Seriatopora caliendrum]YP_002149684.1 NADH dehydrogenase subunit 4L [Madracis myriaster]YP_002149710.1 NADH dehydrogenase subunit 4L [Stylophora pistillata]ARU77430.1 NADH dehydrogenase subunit 4L [Madracis decactis]ABO77157.1 NADH dehydrogenase subunit 4L [Poc
MYYKYLVIIIILFLLGSWGIILNRGHFIIMLVSIELVLLSTFFFFLISSKEIDLLIEQIFMIMGLTIAAAESSIGLAILVAYYRIRGTIVLKSFSSLRG